MGECAALYSSHGPLSIELFVVFSSHVIRLRRAEEVPCTNLNSEPKPRTKHDMASLPVTASLPATLAVETFALVKQFGEFVAVDHIDLKVSRGSFFGFLGPNGAGKSTTIKMLTGLLAPTSGKLRVLDFDIGEQPMEVKRRIGVVPEDLNLFERLTGAEMLSFTGRMYGLRSDEIAQRSKELLELMELAGEPKKLVVLKGWGHYEVYAGRAFTEVMGETLAWYQKHLPARV